MGRLSNGWAVHSGADMVDSSAMSFLLNEYLENYEIYMYIIK